MNRVLEGLPESAKRKLVMMEQPEWEEPMLAMLTNRRSDDWLKFKCVENQEFVIGGYTEPHGKRIEFGPLLVGYYKDGKLMYAGKVGTGFSEIRCAA